MVDVCGTVVDKFDSDEMMVIANEVEVCELVICSVYVCESVVDKTDVCMVIVDKVEGVLADVVSLNIAVKIPGGKV